MELWIRSQNKECLTMVNHLYVDDNHHIRQQDDLILGTYEIKRALEVLDEIQHRLITLCDSMNRHLYVYEMPKD